MRKPSKYETMAKMKQIVKMSFADVQVTGYRNPKVTSKTGREYRKYEVEIDSVLWVSTTSFNKQSFSKRYFKAIKNVKVVKEEEPTKFELVVSEFQKDRNTFSDLRKSDDLDAFMGCETEEEVKETYKRLAKIYHPDCGGSQIQFEALKDRYEFALRRVRRYAEVVGEIKEMQDLRTTYNLKDLKSAYRKLSMKHHPDHGGDVEQFKLVKIIYDVRKLCIEETLEVFDYDDPNFAFLVDLDEDLYKTIHKIVY